MINIGWVLYSCIYVYLVSFRYKIACYTPERWHFMILYRLILPVGCLFSVLNFACNFALIAISDATMICNI